MNTLETTTTNRTGNLGWSSNKRHIIEVRENEDREIVGRPRALCQDTFRWDGKAQPTMIKKEAPSLSNITCLKCRALI